MKNAAVNNLRYTGTVTLSQYINNKKIPIKQIKNSGGNSLFNFLSNCLMGDFDTAYYERPTKIMLLYTTAKGEDPSKISVEPVSGFIHFLTQPERIYSDTSMASSTVCYSFVIPMDLIESTNFNSIGLYADMATELDAENYAALCDVGDMSRMQSASSVLLVDWRLTITNNG